MLGTREAGACRGESERSNLDSDTAKGIPLILSWISTLIVSGSKKFF